MSNTEQLTEEQTDYLKELMNIATGNAAAALSQLLKSDVQVRISAVYTLPPAKVPSAIGGAELPVVCVKMRMYGDVNGEMFFIVPEKEKGKMAHLAEKAMMGAAPPLNPPLFKGGTEGGVDLSAIEEIGNIMTGVYLAAIHDFCKLNIYHSVPAVSIDMFQPLLDELLANLSRQAENVIVIENVFAIVVESEVAAAGEEIRAFLLMVPSVRSVKALVDSIKAAMPE